MTETPQITLNDASSIPAIGFGTYPLVGREGFEAVSSAIDVGYRLLDSAVNYENEGTVGAAISGSGVASDDITVQTKLPGRHHDTDAAVRSGWESRYRLGVEQIDVLLIHWPNPITGKYREAWRGLVELQRQGVVRTIGVSNFTEQHLRDIIDDSGVVPAINQVELHPRFPQQELLAAHRELGIQTQAWSPLGKRKPAYEDDAVASAAAAHGVSPAQVILRWHFQRGVIPLPKSATPVRQAANLGIFGFELTHSEVAAITALGRADGRLFDGDPNQHEEH
ncbi:aldo/keto reductase [uncultured Agrococcus sp.]|uniref:aldo/keto reductase n=1 Tax=uncultured Agrococcus sp. TaxID=382258 RepID=UPI0025CF8B0D|nr:aldo/keto reductase [uncultured Agrococcus sp.]